MPHFWFFSTSVIQESLVMVAVDRFMKYNTSVLLVVITIYAPLAKAKDFILSIG